MKTKLIEHRISLNKEHKIDESLLQDLQSDTKILLSNSGASREQLDNFIEKSGCDLSDVLYSERWYNAFIEFLKDGSLPKGLKHLGVN